MRSLNVSVAANLWALLLTGVKGSSASSMGCGRKQSLRGVLETQLPALQNTTAVTHKTS